MTRYDRLDRRTFVTQLSRTAFGFVILGGTAVACASGDGVDASDSDGTGAANGTDSTTTTDSTAATTGDPEGTDAPVGGAGDWLTVDLGFVAAYVLVRGGEAVVVDTGTSGSEDAILTVLEDASTGWSGVAEVILTHRHPDHVGSVPAVLEAAPDARAYAGEQDIPAITSPRDLFPLTGGEVVSGLEIVATPGHTAGHISVLDRDARVLVAGDALNGDGSGGLAGPNPDFSQDMDQAWASVATLAEQADAIATILPGHGGTVAEDAGGRLRALAQANS